MSNFLDGKRSLKEWNVEEIKNFIIYENSLPIAQFIIDEEEQIPAMVEFLKKNVNKLLTIEKNEPNIFNQ
jgi:PII-like signaling protein